MRSLAPCTACSSLHSVGILYALLFVFPVLSAPELKGSPAAQFQGKLYATSMILLFGSSTVYHTLILVAPDSVWCKRAQVFDRSMIFIYIAATYTPMLYFYGDPDVNYTTWFSLWLVWIVGLAGVVYSFFFQGSLAEIQELAMYLVQGAIPGFLAMEPLLATMPRYVGYSMLAGMLSYGVGTIFFSSDGKLPFAHAIWHVCVLAGTLSLDIPILEVLQGGGLVRGLEGGMHSSNATLTNN